MNVREFSDEFDVLYNNITSNQAPGLNEYEKSVFLTKAQYDVLKSYFDPAGNKFQQGFDGSKKRQADFTNLIKTKSLVELSISPEEKFDRRSRCYSMPNDLFLPINEKCNNDTLNFVVTPISYQEYDSLMLKPYQYPVKRQVWRLFTDRQAPVTKTTTTTVNNVNYEFTFTNVTDKKVTFILNAVPVSQEKAPTITETKYDVRIVCSVAEGSSSRDYCGRYLTLAPIMPYLGYLRGPNAFPDFIVPKGYTITIEIEPSTFVIELIGKMPKDINYIMRYLIKPEPIILVDLKESFNEEISIEGISAKTECRLDPQLHPEVLQRGK